MVREQDPKDKRSVYAHLTDKGNEYLDKIYPIHSLRIARAFSGLMPEEQEQLIALLKKREFTASICFSVKESGYKHSSSGRVFFLFRTVEPEAVLHKLIQVGIIIYQS